MVEWKKLGDFALVQKTKNKKHITENAYSITQAGLIPTKSFFKEKTNVTSKDTSGYYIVEKDWFVYSPSRIDVGSISYLKDEGPVIVSPIDVVFSIDKSICMPDYLLSYFFTYNGRKDLLRNIEGVEGMGRRNLPFDAIKNMQIPIPSLSEQNRIVGILDTFTSSIENLKEQIAQRRKQYEYYLDKLYYASKADLLEASQRGETIVKPFSEIGTFTRGRRFVRTDIVPEGVPCIHYGDMYTYYGISAAETPTHLTKELASKLRFAKYGDVVIVAAGENDLDIGVGVAWFGKEPVVVHDACFIFEHDMNPKYISHYLRSRNYHQQIRMGVVDGKICSISAKELGRALIAVPSKEEQQRIVDILDKFEASIQNLEAQLSLREKQYEYYRNKLLTFE